MLDWLKIWLIATAAIVILSVAGEYLSRQLAARRERLGIKKRPDDNSFVVWVILAIIILGTWAGCSRSYIPDDEANCPRGFC